MLQTIGIGIWIPILLISSNFTWPVAQAVAVASLSAETDAVRHAKSKEMQSYMNQVVDPCEDFYNFACGNWPVIHPATLENKQTLYFHQVSFHYMDDLAEILVTDNANDEPTLKKVKKFYRSCLNVSPVKSVYRDKLVEIIREFGHMPALEGERWQVNDFDWLKTIGRIAYKYNKHIILDFEMAADASDKSKNVLELRPAKLILPQTSLYLEVGNEHYRMTHRNRIADDLRDFLELDGDLARQTAKDIVEFEVLLVQGIKTITSPKTQTVDGLLEKYRERLDFKKFLRTALGSVPDVEVVEKTPSYHQHLAALMPDADQSKVANFIFYYLIRDFIMAARRPDKAPQQSCVHTTRRIFYTFLENMMFHKLNLFEAAKGVQNMFADLKAIFQSDLQANRYHWMGNETRTHALQKLSAMTIRIDCYDHVNFHQMYENLEMSPHAFMENLKNLFTQFGNHARGKQVDAHYEMFDETNILFGPGYNVRENRVIIPVISLLPHYFWSTSYPNALNFGQLGAVVAHEIVHGFDNNGRNIDIEGKQRQWWDAHSTNNFTLRTQCFRKQYKDYVFGDKPLPERYDQAENIADNGGVRLAYEAYMNWYTSPWHPKALNRLEQLPGLKYTGAQLFFLGFAQIWCSETHPYFKSLQTTTDQHTPPQFRVVGTLSNLEGFATTFECKPGSGMNPEQKCEIY